MPWTQIMPVRQGAVSVKGRRKEDRTPIYGVWLRSPSGATWHGVSDDPVALGEEVRELIAETEPSNEEAT